MTVFGTIKKDGNDVIQQVSSSNGEIETVDKAASVFHDHFGRRNSCLSNVNLIGPRVSGFHGEGMNMGGFILVLLLVVVVCAGIPLALFAYAQGRLLIPKRFLTIIIFGANLIVAIFEFPIRFSFDRPFGLGTLLIVYAFIAGLLSYEYTKRKWQVYLPLIFLTNCLGVLIKYFIIIFAMVKNKVGFTYIDVAVFLIITQFIRPVDKVAR